MEFIYNSYFKQNPYPSLVLKPENGSIYRVYDVNDAFLEIMQVERKAILNQDFFESFLKNEKNVTSVVTTILKTSLAFVKTYWTPRRIEKLPITHVNRVGGEKNKLWEIYNSPVIDENNDLKFLILIAREIESELDLNRLPKKHLHEINFTNKKLFLVLQQFSEMMTRRADDGDMLYEAFQIIGEILKVGRLYYYKNGESLKSFDNNGNRLGELIKVEEWSAGGDLLSYVLPYNDTEEMLLPLSQRIEFCKNKSEINNEYFKNLLSDNEVKSIYALPLFLNEEFHGFLGVEDCKKERAWSAEEKDFMKCVASQLAITLENKKEV